MKKLWVLIAGLSLGSAATLSSPADAARKKADVEDTSPEAAKAAAAQASSEADKWAASLKSEKPTPPIADPDLQPEQKPAKKAESAEKPVDKPAETPAAKPTPVPAAAPVKRVGLNEIKGKLLSKSYDPKAIRLIVNGGFNVEFSFDVKSSIVSGGQKVSIEDLGYGDEVAVRYAGKDLYAIEIERLSKASRPE